VDKAQQYSAAEVERMMKLQDVVESDGEEDQLGNGGDERGGRCRGCCYT